MNDSDDGGDADDNAHPQQHQEQNSAHMEEVNRLRQQLQLLQNSQSAAQEGVPQPLEPGASWPQQQEQHQHPHPGPAPTVAADLELERHFPRLYSSAGGESEGSAEGEPGHYSASSASASPHPSVSHVLLGAPAAEVPHNWDLRNLRNLSPQQESASAGLGRNHQQSHDPLGRQQPHQLQSRHDLAHAPSPAFSSSSSSAPPFESVPLSLEQAFGSGNPNVLQVPGGGSIELPCELTFCTVMSPSKVLIVGSPFPHPA